MSFFRRSKVPLKSNDLKQAVAQLSMECGPSPGVVMILLPQSFCQKKMADLLSRSFSCPLICCSCASSIMDGDFNEESLTALSIDASVCKAHSFFIQNLDHEENFQQQCQNILDFVKDSSDRQKLLGLTIIDGLCMREEWVAQSFSRSLQGIPMVGGSSSDNLEFVNTPIFYEGVFHSDAALLVILELEIDFEVFKIQHFYPTQQRFIITEVEPTGRTIYEINGEPAANAYAKMIHKTVDDLSYQDLNEHPLVISLGGDSYIRSLKQIFDDGSLSVYGTVEEGAVFRVAQADDIGKSTLEGLEKTRALFQSIEGVLGFSCILRRQEANNKLEKQKALKAYYKQYELFGFHSYGEQYMGHHVNQSLTGVFFGNKKR